MLNMKKILTKILATVPIVGTNYIKIGGIGICWGHVTTGTNSAAIATFPIEYKNTSSIYTFVTSVYGSSLTYAAISASVQMQSTRSMYIYGRAGSSTIGAGYGINWVAIGLI